MKREFLEDLGLEKEVIDKIMAENGKDINTEKAKLTAKEKEVELLNDQLKNANKSIKSYKDMDIDEIKKSAEEFEAKYRATQQEMAKLKEDTSLNLAIRDYNSVDEEVLLKLIDREALKFTDDGITGLKEQIDGLREAKPYLFKADDSDSDDSEADDRFNPHVPPSNSGGDVSALEAQIASIFND